MSESNTKSQQESGNAWNPNFYDDKHSFVWKYGGDLVALLAPQPGERILDLGCGTGHLTAQIAESGAHVVGVDRAESMIAAAQREYPKLQFQTADARDLPFDQQFDAVFSNAALHWVHEPERAVRGIARALRPGGRFVAELGGKGNVRLISGAMDRALAELRGAGEPIRVWYFPSVGEYSTLLERNGLEVRFMSLFDRPTALSDGAAGLRNWIAMFCAPYLAAVPAAAEQKFLDRVEALLRPQLFHQGEWRADYRRLRLVAVRV
jgi:trans-aconitate methyltransferase